MLKPGTMLGPYEVLAQIGAGVYQSRDSNGAATQSREYPCR